MVHASPREATIGRSRCGKLFKVRIPLTLTNQPEMRKIAIQLDVDEMESKSVENPRIFICPSDLGCKEGRLEEPPFRTLSFYTVVKQVVDATDTIRSNAVNHLIPWAESVQLCGRGRTRPFREEEPCFGFASASREMRRERTRAKSAHIIVQIPLMEGLMATLGA